MIYKPLFFLTLLLIDTALHCNKTTLWYQVMFALQTDRCAICLLNLFKSGTHTESGVGCELYQTLSLFINMRLCAMIPDSQQQIPPIWHRPLSGFPFEDGRGVCSEDTIHTHINTHPSICLSPMSLHSTLEWSSTTKANSFTAYCQGNISIQGNYMTTSL